MGHFSENLIPTYLYGYYWRADTQQLYSIKFGNELRPLKKYYKFEGNYNPEFPIDKVADEWFYQVSDKGHRRTLGDKYLNSLTV